MVKNNNRRGETLVANKHKAAAIETYPLDSVDAARKMAAKVGDNSQERAYYGKTLLRESRALGAYISAQSVARAKGAA